MPWTTGILGDDQRRARLIAMYRGGETLQEMGDALGVTRERIRQLTDQLVDAGDLQRRPKRKGFSLRGLEEVRAKRTLRPKGSFQREPDRNAEIERLVGLEQTYSQVAAQVGCTRNVVCTVMYRAKRR